MLTQVGVMGLVEAPPRCPHPPTLSPWLRPRGSGALGCG